MNLHLTRQSRFVLALLSMGAIFHLPGAEAHLVADATIDASFPQSNFGALPQLQAGPQARALLAFNLSMIPITGQDSVSRAFLKVFFSRVNTAPTAVTAGMVSPIWDEATVSWTSQPAALAGPLLQGEVTRPAVWVYFDVTQQVKDAAKLGAPSNMAFIVSAANTVFIDSKENTATSHPAELEIVLAGPAGPQGAVGATGVPGATGSPGATGVTGAAGPTGATGASGATGATGAPGAPGAAGARGATGPGITLSGSQVRDIETGTLTIPKYFLSCSSDMPKLVSGGCGFPFYSRALDAAPTVTYSGPDPSDSEHTWMCYGANSSVRSQTMRIYVLCAK